MNHNHETYGINILGPFSLSKQASGEPFINRKIRTMKRIILRMVDFICNVSLTGANDQRDNDGSDKA